MTRRRLIAAAALLLPAGAAMSEPSLIPRGLGHPQPGESHWYDNACCDTADCEPVEPGAIVEVPGGFRVRYFTSRGFLAEGFVPRNSTKYRESKDGREHACASRQAIICIYLPPRAM